MKNKWLVVALLLINVLNISYLAFNYFDNNSKNNLVSLRNDFERVLNITNSKIKKINKEILPDFEKKLKIISFDYECHIDKISKFAKDLKLLEVELEVYKNCTILTSLQLEIENEIKITQDVVKNMTKSTEDLNNLNYTFYKYLNSLELLKTDIEKTKQLVKTNEKKYLLSSDYENSSANMTSFIEDLIVNFVNFNTSISRAFRNVSNDVAENKELLNIYLSKIDSNQQEFEHIKTKVDNFKNDIVTAETNNQNKYVDKLKLSEFIQENEKFMKLYFESEYNTNKTLYSLMYDTEKNFTLFNTINDSFRNNVLRYLNSLEVDASNTKNDLKSQIMLINKDISRIIFLLDNLSKIN